MIGFTFAIALSRFEARREAVLNEANAIGTTALRARLLPAPHNAEALNVLREYVQLRLDITRRVPSSTELNATTARSNGLWCTIRVVDVGLVAWRRFQAMRCDTGIPSRVIRLSTAQPTRASVFWAGSVRARRPRPMTAL